MLLTVHLDAPILNQPVPRTTAAIEAALLADPPGLVFPIDRPRQSQRQNL